uniref:Reverse transcriptase Ty1/copia-type domain-containing protein n=1 Tax=Physcomitrium patens TaxID=3218 RepID=A0A7I4DHU1_PHYPA
MMNAMIYIRFNIAHTMKTISRFIANFKSLALYFKKNNVNLCGFTNVDFNSDLDSYTSIIGFVFTLEGFDVNWMFKLQKSIALSITKI